MAAKTSRTIVLSACLTLVGLAPLLGRQAGAAQQGQAAAAAALLEGTAAVSGVVTDATTGQPIPGVIVYLGFQGRGAVGRLSRQLTDDRGRFVFTDLPAGNNYFFITKKFAYQDGHYGVGADGLLGGLITLADGQWFNDANITMERPGAISGTVLDEHGAPAVGAFVRLLAMLPVAGRILPAAGPVTRTDDRGVYRFADLIPGRYVVHVPFVQQTVPAAMTAAEAAGLTPEQVNSGRVIPEPPAMIDFASATRLVVSQYLIPPPPVNGRPQTYPSMFYPGSTSLSGAATIELKPGDERRGIDVALRAAAAAPIAGVVDGPPGVLAGLNVRLLADGLEAVGTGSEVASTTLGADGKFALGNVPAGTYLLDVRKAITELTYTASTTRNSVVLPPTPGNSPSAGRIGGSIRAAPDGTSFYARSGAGSSAYFAQMKIITDARPIVDLRVPLQRGVTIRGRIVSQDAPPAGPGRPSAPASIYAEPADGNFNLGMTVGTVTAGTFEIEGIPGGKFLLRFPSAGGIVSVMGDDGIDHVAKPIDTSSGRDFEVVITTTSKYTDLSGTAADARGAQTKNAIVFAFPVERDQWSDYGLSPARIRSSPTTSSGTYQIQGLPPGEYFVVAVPPDQANTWQDPAKLARLAASAVRVTLVLGEQKTQNIAVVSLR